MDSSAPPHPPRREKAIAPAIYFTPSSSSVNLHPRPATASKSYEHMSLAELQSELDYLLKSVSMLLASNSEMQQMDPQRTDPDLTQAIGENIAIVLRRNASISRLRHFIGLLQPHALPATQVPPHAPQQPTAPPAARAVTFASPENHPNNHHAPPSTMRNGLYL